MDGIELDNKILRYDYADRTRKLKNNEINPFSGLYADLERESTEQQNQQAKKSLIDLLEPTKKVSPSSAGPEIKASGGSDAAVSNMDRIKSIAFNSREVRLVGPDQKEVEMKDDVGTKLVVALENLQKEATEVWGQVNERLDKGWTELKTMVEKAVAPGEKKTAPTYSSNSRHFREAPSQSSMVVVSDVDGYSMADETADSAAKQAESAGQKIKGFFSDIGLNASNQKKAEDALSKAGTAVSETVTKDLPDALKKAGSVVSDTVTKDIPDAFKNFFG